MVSTHRLKAVAFDSIETLFELSALRPRIISIGLPGDALPLWFAHVLRDAFALDATEVFLPFSEVAGSALEGLMLEHGIASDSGKVQHVLEGMSELPAHPDVKPAFEILRQANIPVFVLTNGSAQTTRAALKHAQLDSLVKEVISIDGVKHWKPRRGVYLYAADIAGVAPAELALVAAHGWDIQGGARAGLRTGWLPRTEKQFPKSMSRPDVQGETLVEVVENLLAV